jgi:mediator of RNA polymerase II transcription subunit 13
MNVGGDGLWNPEDDLVTIAWPAALCFSRIAPDMGKHADRRLSRGHDPLSFAEGWFSSRAIREAEVAKRQKERESAAAAVQAQAEIDARNIALNNFSPAGLRRASIAGAVYPTPPDGIQHAIGATPSFDGNGSTPGPPNTQTMAIESDNAAIPKSEAEYADGNLWDPNEVKRDQISSTLDFNDNDNDNLFGDMGGDLFGENDVTDADFSFFDEPDPVENAEGSAANDENSVEDIRVDATQHGVVGCSQIDTVGSGAELDESRRFRPHRYPAGFCGDAGGA